LLEKPVPSVYPVGFYLERAFYLQRRHNFRGSLCLF
jgi:hypothetical protein